MNKSETVPTLLPKKQRAIVKSSKLDNVCYDIRGPVLREAHRLEEEGHKVYKLNIGNPAPWGFEAPEEILRDVIHNIPLSQGYSDSHGVYSARKAVMQYYQKLGIAGVDVDDVYIGNGVSELVGIAMQALAVMDRGGQPVPRQAGALPLRRGRGLAARPRRYPSAHHPENARVGSDQSE
jgi:hypothetical protein